VARDHGAKPQRLDAVAPFDNSGFGAALVTASTLKRPERAAL
jgi:hypothetical protein